MGCEVLSKYSFESHRKTALLFTDDLIVGGAISCGVGGVIFSVFVSRSIYCSVLDKLSDDSGAAKTCFPWEYLL